MAEDLRKMQYADTAYDKTLLVNPPQKPEKPAHNPLLDDLDEFTKRYDLEEQARLRAAAEERLKKEEQPRHCQEDQPRKRAPDDRLRHPAGTARPRGPLPTPSRHAPLPLTPLAPD